jgi:thiamine-phosphate pyrophosphorylase
MRGLYAIADLETLELRGLDPLRFAEALLSARPAALQIRDKAGGARRALALLRALVPLASRAGVPLFANDRPDVAVLAGCSGVHVGQDDLPVRLVREVAPGLRVGLSTHDAGQLEAALAEGPDDLDYVAIGPVFPTATKDRPSPVVGLDRLASLAARVRAVRPGLPIVAIGGITLETAAAVGARVDAAAVIGALVPDDAPTSPSATRERSATYDAVAARAAALHAAILTAQRPGALRDDLGDAP